MLSPGTAFFALFLEKPLLYVVSDREREKGRLSIRALQSVAGSLFSGGLRGRRILRVKLQSNFRQKEVVAVVEAQDLHLDVEDLDYFLTHSFLLEKERKPEERSFGSSFQPGL